VTSRDGANNPTGYNYIYNYSITASGQADGTQQATVSEKGSMIFSITGRAATTTVNFSAFGMFVDDYPPCTAPLVPGTMTGPMFTNGAWQFTTGSYIFTDAIAQANANADYWFGARCFQAPTSTYTYNGQTIRPTFQGGFNLNRPTVPLPTNDFSQRRAVLDGVGMNLTNPTNAEMNAALKNVSGNAYPLAGASSGVYFAYTQNGIAGVMTGGGFFIEGNATITLSTSGTSAQVATITNGTPAVTTTVTTDPLATPPPGWGCPVGTTGTTVVTSGATTKNLCSVPTNYLTNHAATMLYVNGSITSVKGPGPGQAAIQDHSQMTITAKNDVTATGDILYKTQPVTTTQNQIVPGTDPACCNGTPPATLIPGHDRDQVLGIFTTNGDFNLKIAQTNGNLQIDASIATISQGGDGGIKNTGAAINTLNIVGGRIQNAIYTISAQTRNVFFDRRFTNRANFAPPWFPATTVTQGGALPTNITSSVQRVQWLNQTTLQ
jgi:hypothetical protein